jgi:hypothetical protein
MQKQYYIKNSINFALGCTDRIGLHNCYRLLSFRHFDRAALTPQGLVSSFNSVYYTIFGSVFQVKLYLFLAANLLKA